MPTRIKLERTKGWRKPEGAINVARPTKYGNPFKVGADGVPDAATAVGRYHCWLLSHPDGKALLAQARQELRGHDLMCYCDLDAPCHADVLLELVNLPDTVRQCADCRDMVDTAREGVVCERCDGIVCPDCLPTHMVEHAQELPESNEDMRRCRVCGCMTDDCSGCVERTGEPCYWVEDDLCSACVDEPDRYAALLGSDVLPAYIEIGDYRLQLGFVVGHAFDQSQLTREAWNALPGADREARLAACIETIKPADLDALFIASGPAAGIEQLTEPTLPTENSPPDQPHSQPQSTPQVDDSTTTHPESSPPPMSAPLDPLTADENRTADDRMRQYIPTPVPHLDLESINQIARHLSCSHPTVLRLIRQEALPAVKVGGVWKSWRVALNNWLVDHQS